MTAPITVVIPSADAIEVRIFGNSLEILSAEGCLFRITRCRACVVNVDGDPKLFANLERTTRQ